MRKILTASLVLMVSMTARAEVIRLHVTTHVQDGVHFPELGQCFLSAAEPREIEGEDVLIQMEPGRESKIQGSWKKTVTIDERQIEYRLIATQNLTAKSPLKIRSKILVDGTVENSGSLDLEGGDQWGFPVNFLEATASDGGSTCFTANITVVKIETPALPISIANEVR